MLTTDSQKELANLIELEYKRGYNLLCKKLSKEVVDEFYRLMDEKLAIRIEEQFENFAEAKQLK